MFQVAVGLFDISETFHFIYSVTSNYCTYDSNYNE